MPPAGEMARYRVKQWLAFISSELNKSFSPLFKPGTPEETKIANRDHLGRRLKYVDEQLAGRSFLTGETFTAADAYICTILGWAKFANLDLAQYANIQKSMSRRGAPGCRSERPERGSRLIREWQPR